MTSKDNIKEDKNDKIENDDDNEENMIIYVFGTHFCFFLLSSFMI